MTIESVAILLARIALAVSGVGVLLIIAAWLLATGLQRFASALGYWHAFVQFYSHRERWKNPPRRGA